MVCTGIAPSADSAARGSQKGQGAQRTRFCNVETWTPATTCTRYRLRPLCQPLLRGQTSRGCRSPMPLLGLLARHCLGWSPASSDNRDACSGQLSRLPALPPLPLTGTRRPGQLSALPALRQTGTSGMFPRASCSHSSFFPPRPLSKANSRSCGSPRCPADPGCLVCCAFFLFSPLIITEDSTGGGKKTL